ncbi:MAG: phosphoribosylanthranilate isomerase [Leptolyngbyaceae cyanobacterium bins.349]|nr:phosphoribosylanthranilate isomerase [Leptolyngbyaceae cyanobacterium bins.349]
MNLRVKICGITQPHQGRAIAQMGASMLGFICAPTSPRYVTPEQIANIVAALPQHPDTGQPSCDRVGVFVDADIDMICRTVAIAHLNGVQLHGQESPEFCWQLRQYLPAIELIKALRVHSSATLNLVEHYQHCVDTLLLDAYDPNLAGGTGKTLNWHSLQAFHPPRPWLLAGGLTPDNIREALTQTHPTGIDLSSGVEVAPGIKDLRKVGQLLAQLETL